MVINVKKNKKQPLQYTQVSNIRAPPEKKIPGFKFWFKAHVSYLLDTYHMIHSLRLT